MKRVKTLNISGSTPAFVPAMSSVTGTTEQQVNTVEVVTPAVPVDSQCREYLSRLPEASRKALLQEVFELEIETLIKNTKQQALAEAEQIAEQVMQQKGVEHELRLNQEIEDWRKAAQVAAQCENWVIDQAEHFKSLVFKAVTKILGRELSGGQEMDSFYSKLIADYVEHSPKSLALSPLQFRQLSESTTSFDSSEFILLEDASLTPGSYVLTLQDGTIEYHMDQALEAFQKGLLDAQEQEASQ